jgi:glutamate synthase (NADPH) large subunit (EC 1.4.1.13)
MALYSHDDERDNCGFGLIAQVDGQSSHAIITKAITGLANMQHRGGINADGKTGDGCGLLLQLPQQFFRDYATKQNWHLSKKFAVGMVFLSTSPENQKSQKQTLEAELRRETLSVEGWREVPTNADVLGSIAQATQPSIQQVIVSAPPGWRKKDLERRLYMARRRTEQLLADDSSFYVCSLSCLVIVYKGLMLARDLANFYLDLADPTLTTSHCVFHQRFSTNTQPQWRLAQPFRFLAHNGEINAIRGNRQWALARQYKFHSPLLADMQQAAPLVNRDGSDSSALDNMLELLLAGGMDLFRALRLLIPPAWQGNATMSDPLRAFYEFNSMHMEPWDGPAGIVMSNGRQVACSLDRNGLRPARIIATNDGLVTIASEVGIWDYRDEDVIEKGRLGPGEMVAIDTYTGRIWRSSEIDDDLQQRHPYRDWLNQHIRHLKPFRECTAEHLGKRLFDDATMAIYHKLHMYSREELLQVLAVLAEDGHEATGSMGDDTPIAVLSQQPRDVFDYFRQQFAQVTNPPIDPIRERHVMSLATCIGREQNVFNETSGYAERVVIESPVLMYTDLKQLRELPDEHYKLAVLNLGYDVHSDNLQQALVKLTTEAVRLVREDAVVLVVLSDRVLNKNHHLIPVALAVGAVQQALVRESLRCDSNIIVETGSVRDAHQMAVLIGLGATAVYPFLAYESIEQLVERGDVGLPVRDALQNYREGINKGLLKIMSKMGIATVASYRGACLFEIVGLAPEVRERCFAHAPARIGGATFADLEAQIQQNNAKAWSSHHKISAGGLLKYVHGGEYHAYNPDVVMTLQQAVNRGDANAYRQFADHVNHRPISFIRDLLVPTPVAEPLDLSEIEAATELFHRFDTAAMSIGALSPEAHEALAQGMNRIGGHSNSGEGGEDARRFGTDKNSRIKQVASGRFGVTPHYLVNADVLQIKIAQGAKPGEGGQLPGEKVTAEIAKLRYAVAGTTLISPPPHHDIYSIEDLAQLIFDLKQVNPQALVSVKLVSSPGIGTIATGVAKAYADLITVSGYDGGTGASPLTSVKHAGSPWELGLAEVHEALVSNNLRHKVRVQVDGGLKTGLDVIKAAILGAESFGFGTAPMIALGCKYLRICHLNNCATGVATQDEALRREHFTGLPERVAQYFEFVAEEVRYWLAQLGLTQLTDLIGRVDLLTRVTGVTQMQKQLDLSQLLAAAATDNGLPRYCTEANIPHDCGELNRELMAVTHDAIQQRLGGTWQFKIRNYDRAVGANLAGAIAKKYGNQGMSPHPIALQFRGSAGQSFGAWNAGGLRLELIGDANDYVGKGMAGGRIVLRFPESANYLSDNPIIMGNTCLYGATGGKVFAAGCAGERFAVRNSGATAVVEGVGDHACEYMTGGIVVVLGSTGINFGAGMTGGFAFVHDVDGSLQKRVNAELVELCTVEDARLQEHLRGLIHEHYEHTNSERAHQLLTQGQTMFSQFVLVKPKAVELADLIGHRARSTAELRVEVM